MPTPKLTRFSAFDFTEVEYKQATILQPLQKMYIQTEIAKIAELILNLVVDHKDVKDFEIQHAFLQGQLQILNFMLELSENSEINIRDEEVNQQYVVDPQKPLTNLFTDGETS